MCVCVCVCVCVRACVRALLKMWCYCNTQKWGKTIVPNMALIYGVITAPDFSVIKTLILEL